MPITPPLAGLLVIGLLILLVLFRWHADASRKNFDLSDLWMENGRVSKLALMLLGSFVVTSWIMVHLTLTAKMTEGYLTTYGAIWIAPMLARILKGTPPTTKEDPATP